MRFPSPRDLHEYYHRLPTTDLYFRRPVSALIQREPELPPIRYVRPNIYTIGGTGIITRYGSAEDLDEIEKRGVSRLVYIADDDFAAGAGDANLPDEYRRRLAAFVEGPWIALRARADIVIVSSEALAGAYDGKARVLRPVWHRPPATTAHFDRPSAIEIVHLGTGSHRADLAPLASALAGALAAHPRARLTLFSGDDAPEELKRHAQVRSLQPMKWWRFKRRLPMLRFHLAIYPLRPTPFNAARSANKFFEQALVGAAALMSPNAALHEAAGADLDDIFIDGDAEEWRRRIDADVDDLEACRHRAERTRQRILAIDPLSHAVRVWRDILTPGT